jgi:ribonuclease HII
MKLMLGVDEAGRGPLAGPVAVGVVRCREDFDLCAAFPGLNDSKKLTEPAREAIYELLLERVAAGDVAFNVELVSHRVIDTRGITFAVRRGLGRGVRKLMPDPAEGKVWLDGLLKAPKHYEQETVIHGDGLVPAIMLASVAAKVTRDRYMTRLARRFPHYGFDRHKGYGTDAHYRAIREHGPCGYHRQSYLHLAEREAGLLPV